ncbi:MAG: HlyC/CorC family transporter [Candidatus Zixiibacteriota bacterium]|nr:MAG: HlyC/CorC family transporter [candidate division Zixibacteria bacterium]
MGVLLALSAFFSSVETAFFSLPQSILAELKESQDPRARRVVRLLDRPKELLITILTANSLMNVALAVLAAVLTLRLAEATGFPLGLGLALEVVVITGIILIMGEITPKIMALKHARTWTLWTAMPIDLVCRLLKPLTIVLNLLSGGVSRAMGVERRRLSLSEDEIRALVEVSEGRGALEAEEKEMIQGIFEFSETTVREIMVPRVDIISLPLTANLDDVIRVLKEEGHSRLPIYHDNLDNIAGIIHVKDLLPYMQNGEIKVELADVLRLAHFVPEGKKIDDLLRQFQLEKFHMAIVVDEYGGTAGLVTLEDVLEEIVGEIQDEYDAEIPLFQKLDDNTLLADARINIWEVNEILGDRLIPEEEDYDTLGGFIFSLTGNLPRPKESFDYGDLHFVVEELSGKRIGTIRIERRPRLEEQGAS